jgi:hypothetical protein
MLAESTAEHTSARALLGAGSVDLEVDLCGSLSTVSAITDLAPRAACASEGGSVFRCGRDSSLEDGSDTGALHMVLVEAAGLCRGDMRRRRSRGDLRATPG